MKISKKVSDSVKELITQANQMKKPDLRSINDYGKVVSYICKNAVLEENDSTLFKKELGISGLYPKVIVDSGEKNIYIFGTNKEHLTIIKINLQRWRKFGKDDESHDYWVLIPRDYMVTLYRLLLKLRTNYLLEKQNNPFPKGHNFSIKIRCEENDIIFNGNIIKPHFSELELIHDKLDVKNNKSNA